MGKLLELRISNSPLSKVLVETSEVDGESGVVQAGGKRLTFEEMIQTVKPFCESIITNFKELTVKPTSASARIWIKIICRRQSIYCKGFWRSNSKTYSQWSLE